MMDIVRQFAPNTWVLYQGNQSDVSMYTEEYRQVMFEVRSATPNHESLTARRIIRVQDLHSFGQFLIREQLLINSEDDQLYRVRRYFQVSRSFLDEVIKYNADPRRIGMGQKLTFSNRIDYFSSDKLIVVVKVLTTEPNKADLSPSTSCDYYIEYIIEVQN